jgi:PTS system nitrogen regulatory IIA component
VKLKDILELDCICLDLKADSKEGVIEELIDLLDAAGKIIDRSAALAAVMDREGKMSTGMQDGIAIPHGKCNRVNGLVTAIGIRKDPIEFASLDGKPCSIFVMTLSPLDRTGPHIQFLSEVSRALGDADRRERVLRAQTTGEVIDILSA